MAGLRIHLIIFAILVETLSWNCWANVICVDVFRGSTSQTSSLQRFMTLLPLVEQSLSSILRSEMDTEDAEDILQVGRLELWKMVIQPPDESYYATSTIGGAIEAAMREAVVARQLQLELESDPAALDRLNLDNAAVFWRDPIVADRVPHAMLRLLPIQEHILRLAYYRGESNRQIADHLHVPITYVRNHLYLGLSHLRESPLLRVPQQVPESLRSPTIAKANHHKALIDSTRQMARNIRAEKEIRQAMLEELFYLHELGGGLLAKLITNPKALNDTNQWFDEIGRRDISAYEHVVRIVSAPIYVFMNASANLSGIELYTDRSPVKRQELNDRRTKEFAFIESVFALLSSSAHQRFTEVSHQ